jgi:hypothetical protein
MGALQSKNMIAGCIVPLAIMIFIGAHFSAQGAVADFRSFLDQNCVKCHSGDKAKGDLLLDHVASDFTDKTSREQWERILEQLESGSMPPKSKPRPPATEQRAVCDWIIAEVTAAKVRLRETEGRVVLRRLNRNEYENTVRDLLGVE